MAVDQYTVIQLAAALSMIGWVARSPDYLPNNVSYPLYNDYFELGHNFFPQDDQISATLVETQQSIYQINDNFHESKYIRDDFRTLSELQDLVSWQEAFRRGDFSFSENPRYIYPVVSYEANNEDLFSELQSPNYYDDGYGSGETNVGSPEVSDLSSLVSLNLDDISASSSPASLGDILGSEELTGAVGYSAPEDRDVDFDVADLLDDVEPLSDSYANIKGIHSKSFSDIEDFGYSNSPLLNPTLDEYLCRVTPSDQSNHSFDSSFDDPFRIDFTSTNSSFPNGKFVAEPLELNQFEESSYAATLGNDFHTYGEADHAGESNGKVNDDPSARKEDLSSISNTTYRNCPSEVSPELVDHDHNYVASYEELETSKAVNSITSRFQGLQQLEEASRAKHTRTYAPPPRTYSPSPRLPSESEARENKKCSTVWPDFPYTSEELIVMDIDEFTDIVSKLDESKQIIVKNIRKKGKNKLAARTCRKRKMEILDSLDTNVDTLERQKDRLLLEQQLLLEETRQIHEKTEILNNYILEHLFAGSGGSYPHEYALDYSKDGNVFVVPLTVKTDNKRIQDV